METLCFREPLPVRTLVKLFICRPNPLPFSWLLPPTNNNTFYTQIHVVTAVCTTQGLAFATVSGIPLLYGLYIVWAPPFFYSLFGVSLHVSYGPFALVGLFISDALHKRGYQPCDGLCRHDTEETRVSLG